MSKCECNLKLLSGFGLVLPQGHNNRHLYRHLLARDVSPRLAVQAAYQRTGVWRRSISSGIHKAYPNAWFNGRLLSLKDHWYALNPRKRVSAKQQRLF